MATDYSLTNNPSRKEVMDKVKQAHRNAVKIPLHTEPQKRGRVNPNNPAKFIHDRDIPNWSDFVYTVWNALGEALYSGRTYELKNRWKVHKCERPGLVKEAAYLTVIEDKSGIPCGTQCSAYEAHTILQLQPSHNSDRGLTDHRYSWEERGNSYYPVEDLYPDLPLTVILSE